ncbi:NADH-quinone oxidoreductase subunit N [Deinococcus pimensis]|uniref:NADH-quinone oxidoreductase subunit N n=1 Tax=Deinococcus pimensis TaxID=309888 RepID=UPI0005EAD1A5|nr:NADH-quinone oxidoreductase subunit N [Deinococcus pimensis]
MLPILIVLAGALVATVAFRTQRRVVAVIAIVALLLSGFSMLTLWGANATAFGGSLRADNPALGFGLVVIVGAVVTLLASMDQLPRVRMNFPEFDAMLLYAVTGMLLIAFAGDLIVLLIGLEIMSLAGYVMATLYGSRRSEESGMKYFLLGSVGSAILIYGIALTFGATGSLSLAGIREAVSAQNFANTPLLIAGALMMLAGFGFKVALVPFHQWTPDVYHGAPTVVTLFLSTVVKVAAFAGLLRVFGGAFPVERAWEGVAEVLVALTLIVGNTAALVQRNFKRLLAYSAVAHTGFLGLALLAEPARGGAALVFYLLAYTLMTAGALAVLALIQPDEGGVENADLRGLYYRQPGLALALAACLASLAGLPPFAGFFGKYLVFQAAFQAGHVGITVLAAMTSVVALVYYLRPAALMFMPAEGSAAAVRPAVRVGTFTGVALGVCVVGIVLLGVLPGLVYNVFDAPAQWVLASLAAK